MYENYEHKAWLKHLTKTGLILLLTLVVNAPQVYAQTTIVKSAVFQSTVPQDVQLKLTKALDTLIYRINSGQPIADEIDSTGNSLSKSMFDDLKGIETYGNKKNDSLYSAQLIGLHSIGPNQYFISLAYIGHNTLKAILNFKADIHADIVKFSIPLFYITRNWKIKKVGRITYHYADYINLKRAAIFNKKNTRIAENLGLSPEPFDFYLADDYFEILKLLGYGYYSETAGHETDGYGPVEGYIFSIMHNEDFSHDLFHYYAAKVRTHSRNGAAEEGVAYSWGNAYYTDANGEMISRALLVQLLKQYSLKNPGISLLELFQKNPPILPSNTKVRSLLASLISDEVERRKGLTGIKSLIDCGRGDDNYFKITDQLIGINMGNFDTEVNRLLINYN